MTARGRLPYPALFLIATGFGLSSTLQAYWLHRLMPQTSNAPAVYLLALNLVYWYIPALLAPWIVHFARRPGLLQAAWPAQAAVHAGGALTYAALHTAVMLAAKAVMVPGGGRPSYLAWNTFALREFLLQLDWMLMTYLFLVGVAFALAYREESERAAVNTAQIQTRLVEAQFQALQRQLHPHFNTLNTISGLVHSDPKAADAMLDRLGDLLRMTLHSSGVQEVRLQEELEVLQKYLEIEQTRFGERLRVTLDVDPALLDVHVPNLLLQPLVENAIRHGVAPKARPGWIAVHAARRNGRLVLEIRDSGDGVAPDRLNALNRGVGLENTRARLQHLYAGDFLFEFENLAAGFCVRVAIPIRPGYALAEARQIA